MQPITTTTLCEDCPDAGLVNTHTGQQAALGTAHHHGFQLQWSYGKGLSHHAFEQRWSCGKGLSHHAFEQRWSYGKGLSHHAFELRWSYGKGLSHHAFELRWSYGKELHSCRNVSRMRKIFKHACTSIPTN